MAVGGLVGLLAWRARVINARHRMAALAEENDVKTGVQAGAARTLNPVRTHNGTAVATPGGPVVFAPVQHQYSFHGIN